MGQNVDYYVVYRDTVMTGAWQPIGTLSPASSSFSDNNLPVNAPAWRYRVDVIWTTTCTPTARTTASSTNTTRSNTKDNYRLTTNVSAINQSDIYLFPNPATESIMLSINGNVKVKAISVFDATGRLVKVENGPASNNILIGTGELAKGIYYVELNTNSGIVRKNFVKN